MVTFHCEGTHIEWTFERGSLPPGVNNVYNFITSLASLTIIILNDSYYGQYRCKGFYKHVKANLLRKGFYDIVMLQKLG